MYLTETDPTHTCSVAIVTNPEAACDATDEFETRDGERYLAPPEHRPDIDATLDFSERIIGRYRLKRCLGRGVTGSVWHAQDVDSADRDVALKIMHADVHDDYVMARYTCEVRALARMDDPHIARIWENGQTPDGKLYIAMELVNGVQLSKFCETWSPSIRDRLTLIIKLCRGLQHTHHRGILHRDLKPANILVTVQDHQVIPKIIDFGLAKSFQKPLLPGSADTTQMGCLLGTIGYMSPEQANTAVRDVDTRSDVYSLCAILYELLTGTLPIPREELHQVSLARALEMIQHREPDAASARVVKNEQAQIHASRCQLTPAKLTIELRGDLDAILEKGLSKERERRYQSAGELADDLERYLSGGVVQARRRTTWYVAQKMMRKHWKTALAVSTISLMFLASWFGLAFGIFYALGERDRAQQAEKLRNASEIMEKKHRIDAERSNGFLESVFTLPHPFVLGQDVKLFDALEAACNRVNGSFQQQPRAEAMVRLTLARISLRLGQSPRVHGLLETLLDPTNSRFSDLSDQRFQGQMLMIQALLELDEVAAAENYCRKAISEVKKDELSVSAPVMRSLYLSLAKALEKKQKFAEAVESIQLAMRLRSQTPGKDETDLWGLRSSLLSVYIKWARAEPSVRPKAMALMKELLNEASMLSAYTPMLIQLRCQQAELLFLDGQGEESHRVLEQAYIQASEKYSKEHLHTQTVLANMAQLYLQEKQYRQAKGILKEVLVTQMAKLGLGHPVTQQSLSDLITVSDRQGQHWQGLQYCATLYDGQCRSLTANHPRTRATADALAQSLEKAGFQWLSWTLGVW